MADEPRGAANADWQRVTGLLATLEQLVTTTTQALVDENAQLRKEIAQLRAETAELRRQLDARKTIERF